MVINCDETLVMNICYLGDGGIGVSIFAGKPFADCYDKIEARGLVESCRTIMDKMDVSPIPIRFGRRYEVDVRTPFVMKSGESKQIR